MLRRRVVRRKMMMMTRRRRAMMSRCFHIPYNFEVKNGTKILFPYYSSNAISDWPHAKPLQMIKISNLDTCMNRTLNLVVLYILRPVSASPSEDIEEHRQSPVPPDTALYFL
jgi:hypothetical protein